MPAAARLQDIAQCPADGHGCPGCPHSVMGPAVTGSNNVLINGRPALRVGDCGIHAACCGPNTWQAVQGSPNVFINGKPAVRVGDQTAHCGGTGRVVTGSSDVFINEGSSGGFGASAPQKEAQSDNVAQKEADLRKDALKAKEKALELLDERIDQLENRWHDSSVRLQFMRFFGTDEEAVKDDVLAKLKRIRAAVAGLDAGNFKISDEPGEYAHVNYRDRTHTIYLAAPFERAPREGRDSKPGILIHEVSHFADVAGTTDYRYGRATESLLLEPHKAAYNADTIEYFVEDAFVTESSPWP